jgi:hypothetical protein
MKRRRNGGAADHGRKAALFLVSYSSEKMSDSRSYFLSASLSGQMRLSLPDFTAAVVVVVCSCEDLIYQRSELFVWVAVVVRSPSAP